MMGLLCGLCCGQDEQYTRVSEPQQRRMRVCPKCNILNDVTAKFCGSCGNSLAIPQGAKVQPALVVQNDVSPPPIVTASAPPNQVNDGALPVSTASAPGATTAS